MTFTVCGLTGYGYGLAAGVSVLAYLCLAQWLSRKQKIKAETIWLSGMIGIPVSLFFARLFFCLASLPALAQTAAWPWTVLYFWDGGFSMSGFLAGVAVSAWIAARLQKVSFRALLDQAVLPLGVLLCGLRLAEGLTEGLGIGRNVEAGALPQSLPFLFLTETMGTLELNRLAVYRYEAAFALVILALTLWFARTAKNRRDGDAAMVFFALYGAGQVFFESMRDDGHMVLGFIRVQQLLGALGPLIVLLVLCLRYGRARGARGAVTAAWAALPVMALVLLMMITPINHVLDLTGKLPLGGGLLLLLCGYCAVFLRRKGANPRLIVTWLLALAILAACVMLEFAMDGSQNLLRDYALLALCCAGLAALPWTLYRANRRLEETV